jgi:hypothetical protein
MRSSTRPWNFSEFRVDGNWEVYPFFTHRPVGRLSNPELDFQHSQHQNLNLSRNAKSR